MIIYIIKWSFIYVILIFLLHNLYLFFQNNLTSTKIKDYYNTYNSVSNNNSQIKNVKEKKVMFSNNLQINSTSLEDLNKYSDFANYNNGLTNDMTSELNEFLNNLKL
jgi:hypothetical protein